MDSKTRSPIRFLALGDSYTIGEAVKAEESWPHQLVGIAAARGIAIDSPVVIAKTGWTTDELLEGISVASPEGSYGLVSLLIGVNNLYRGLPLEHFRTEFRILVRMALQFAENTSGKVVVLSIPDWGATPFAEGKDRAEITRVTDEFNEVCRNEAITVNVPCIDVTGFSRMGLADGSLLTTDGLHPSGAMYTRWARLVCDTMFPDTGRKESGRNG